MQPLNLTFAQKKDIIKEALLHSVALFPNTLANEKLFRKLAHFIDPNLIDDRTLLANKLLIDFVDFTKFSKSKLIRMLIRQPSLVSKIDINKAGFVLNDLMPLFQFHPDMIDLFSFNFGNLTPIEAINVISINPELAPKIPLESYRFSKKEILTIVQKFADNESILARINLKELDHYATRALIVKAGTEYIEQLDTQKLKVEDWLYIVEQRPDLVAHVNIPLFEKGDCFGLVKLVLMFPNLGYLIEQNRDKISALGWEKLLIADPEHYIQICKADVLRAKNWEVIVNQQPKLAGYRNRYFIV